MDETGNLHMELIPPEPQVIIGSCKKGSSQLLNGRFGSLIDPLSGTTLLLTFPGREEKKLNVHERVIFFLLTVVFNKIATGHICSYFRMMLVHLGLPQWQMR